jgi:hypothetical protein
MPHPGYESADPFASPVAARMWSGLCGSIGQRPILLVGQPLICAYCASVLPMGGSKTLVGGSQVFPRSRLRHTPPAALPANSIPLVGWIASAVTRPAKFTGPIGSRFCGFANGSCKGTIEVELAGKPRPGAPADARRFVGVAFRVAADPPSFPARCP